LDALPSGATRRAVLGGTAAMLGGTVMPAVLTGCTRARRAQAPAPGPELLLLTGVMQSEAALLALYDAVMAAHQGLAARLRPLRDHHAQHLAVLRRHYVPGTDEGGATPAPPTTATAPAGEARALAALRTAERRAAAARADEVRRASPGLAQLLAAIGACEAGHAEELA
jgi:hypothetical protein